MSRPFPSRNGNNASTSRSPPYPSIWSQSQAQSPPQRAQPNPRLPSSPSVSPNTRLNQSSAIPISPNNSRTEELQALAKKNTKVVRAWLKEQIAALDDSSSD